MCGTRSPPFERRDCAVAERGSLQPSGYPLRAAAAASRHPCNAWVDAGQYVLMSGIDKRRAQFEGLFRRNIRPVRAYAVRRDPQRAEDVVAETFATAWRRLEQVPGHELPWLLAVARRVLANQRRSEKRQTRLAQRLAQERPAAAEPEDDPRASLALAALRTLSERDREVLLLIERDCLGRDAAATVLGCTRAEVRLRLHRARRRYQAAYLAAGELPPSVSDATVLPGGSSHAC
jgi:RNA polymerase sigma factor (sigma-70 family)